jgi:hypothetical protein
MDNGQGVNYIFYNNEAHPASYPRGTGVLFPGVKHDQGVTLTTHPHLGTEVNYYELYCLSPLKSAWRSGTALHALLLHFNKVVINSLVSTQRRAGGCDYCANCSLTRQHQLMPPDVESEIGFGLYGQETTGYAADGG